jgi:uncharacterized protein YigA (DUF484 family)
MTTEQAENTQGTEAPLGDEAVADFLISNPDFFQRQTDLVARLRVPHGAGAVSLIEHQVSVLRRQLETERQRLAHLIARARDYETLSGRLHGLILQLIAAPDRERVEAALCDSLRREFSAEEVTLKLFPVEAAAEPDAVLSAFRDFLDREHSLCGPLDPERSGALFGDKSEKVASAALIPIRGESLSGVLAVGSADPQRFRPDMGTELLDRLGEVVSQKLRVLNHADG